MKNDVPALVSRIHAIALASMFALCAFAPTSAAAQALPSYAQPPDASADESIEGRVASIDAKYAITIDDNRGFADNVQLHQGTIINPTGLTLSPGMSVTILGYNAGSVFIANQIDTPYSYSGPPPVPVYYGPGWWYPGYSYGYGPSFSLFLSFGSPYVVQRPWYGYWYVHPAVQPWVGYRPPYPVPYGSYRHIAIVHTNIASNVHAPAPNVAGNRFPGQPASPSYAHPSGPSTAPGYANPGSRYGNGMYASSPHGNPGPGAARPSGGAPRSPGAAHGGGAVSHGGGHH